MSIDTREARDALVTLKGGVRNAMSLAMHAAVEAATHSAKSTTLYKDRTGDTRKSLVGESFALSGTVTGRNATIFLENGTRPHIIEARNAKMLRFVINGAVFFRRRVFHPGTEARPFMTIARDLGEQTLDYGASFFVDHAIARYNHGSA